MFQVITKVEGSGDVTRVIMTFLNCKLAIIAVHTSIHINDSRCIFICILKFYMRCFSWFICAAVYVGVHGQLIASESCACL